MHGGAAPQVKRKAVERLAELVDPAIGRLRQLLLQKKDGKVALGAARDILDRNNLTGKTKIEHSGPDGAPLARIEWVMVKPGQKTPRDT